MSTATLPHAVLVYSRELGDESSDFEGRVSRFDDRVASLEELLGFQSIGVPNRRLIDEWSPAPQGTMWHRPPATGRVIRPDLSSSPNRLTFWTPSPLSQFFCRSLCHVLRIRHSARPRRQVR